MVDAPETRSWHSLIIAALVIFVAFAAIWRMVPWLTFPFTQNGGTFDRERMQAIVEQIRALKLSSGEERTLRIDDPLNPKSIRAIKPGEIFSRGQCAGNVSARMSNDGRLSVVIETKDLGHAGEYGFAYIENHPTTAFENGSFTLDVPGHLKFTDQRMKLDDNWWEVYYNLD